ncbi:MAG: hypothetical protein WAK56_10555, partial [Candidatus Sulfotelmatobacter sp.]
AFPASHLFIIGDYLGTTSQMKNFVFTNSIVNAGLYPIWSTGGDATNCAYHDLPLATFKGCFTGSTFLNNVIIAAPSNEPAIAWPAGNLFPASAAAVEFVNYNGGDGGDYQLQPSSCYKEKGTDGSDLGANIAALNAAIAGAQ